MSRKFMTLNQTGDTIVEVLLAIAIVGSIIVGAYVTSNRSTSAERDAQEHSQALTLAQTQLEILRVAGTPPTSTSGCYDVLNYLNSPCYVDSFGNITSLMPSSGSYFYTVTLIKQASMVLTVGAVSVPIQNYEAQVTWPSLSGGTASVQLYYRSQ
jgi:type II secretory pathway pseudopilin PulG